MSTMQVIYIIGDSHLSKCYEQVNKHFKSETFDRSDVVCYWEKDAQQIKTIEKIYKKLRNKNGVPNAVLLLCGGYDLVLKNTPNDIEARYKKVTQHILSSAVKQIIVCSIIERDKVKNSEINKKVKSANSLLAKCFKDKENIDFINIRPPGQPEDFLEDDSYHMKPEFYIHVYERMRTALIMKVFDTTIENNQLQHNVNSTIENHQLEDEDNVNVVNKKVKQESVVTNKKQKKASEKICEPTASSGVLNEYSKEPSFSKRMSEFRSVLENDFQQVCLDEKRLTAELSEMQKKIEELKTQKNEIASTFEKLFNTKLSSTKGTNTMP